LGKLYFPPFFYPPQIGDPNAAANSQQMNSTRNETEIAALIQKN